MNILNIGYDSTNYYLLINPQSSLLVDIGFPGTLGKLQHQLKRYELSTAQISHLLVTHYHPDHAGAAQELVNQGTRLLIIEQQQAAVPQLARYVKDEPPYQAIQINSAELLTFQQSRSYLASLGIAGQILATPGHSDDSVSLVLDDGTTFIGDLGRPYQLDDSNDASLQSWLRLRDAGAKQIYPGHGPSFALSQLGLA
jgi:ribonuclease/clavin/mitogillin